MIAIYECLRVHPNSSVIFLNVHVLDGQVECILNSQPFVCVCVSLFKDLWVPYVEKKSHKGKLISKK